MADTYDAAGRKTDSTFSVSGGSGDPNCADVSNSSSGSPTPYAFAYDAENHHIGARGAQWTPGGQAYYFGLSLAYIHYDGNVPLFSTNTSGALTQIKLESVADINGGGLVSVWDRDISGLLKTGHNSGYYGTIDLGVSMWPAARGLQPVQTTFLGSANSSSLPGLFLYKRLDGFDYSGLTYQGVRAMENATGQWTTPDAYAGNAHDPLSQKAFMWNRNNPYAYSDPAGFYPGQVGDASEGNTGNPFGGRNQEMSGSEDSGGGWGFPSGNLSEKHLSEHERHMEELKLATLDDYADMAEKFRTNALSAKSGFEFAYDPAFNKDIPGSYYVYESKTQLFGIYFYDMGKPHILTFYKMTGALLRQQRSS